MANAPVNMLFDSRTPIEPAAPIAVYGTHMSYEEMITHAFNIRRVAEATLKNEVIPGVIGNRGFLDASILKMISISMNARKASTLALEALNLDSITLDSTTKKYTQLLINGGSGLTIYLFIPPGIDTSDQGALVDYARTELKRSIELADFNIKYFESGTKDLKLDYAMDFFDKQTSFIDFIARQR
ncbi:MAG: hypothetical protein HC902_04260 [Calothrix sp. SM1_5_4]|nr:hypothetical protein [Calothrix sp. SM1_5_4]